MRSPAAGRLEVDFGRRVSRDPNHKPDPDVVHQPHRGERACLPLTSGLVGKEREADAFVARRIIEHAHETIRADLRGPLGAFVDPRGR